MTGCFCLLDQLSRVKEQQLRNMPPTDGTIAMKPLDKMDAMIDLPTYLRSKWSRQQFFLIVNGQKITLRKQNRKGIDTGC